MRFLKFLSAPLAQLAAAGLLAFAGTAKLEAQNLFDPVVRVNERVITAFEVDQRAKLLKVLRAPGELRSEAIERLIDERLQLEAVAAAGLTPTEDQILAGMDEFAGRADLTREGLIEAIAPAGVSPETLRDFIRAGLGWRTLVQARFGPRSQVTEAEVARAMAQSGAGGLRVLLAELILPADTPEAAARADELANEISQYKTAAAFSAAVASYSASPSRDRGGRLDWMPISNLPPAVRGLVITLSPGEVSPAIPIPNGVALFQMRAIEETGIPDANIASIEYAAYYIAGGQSPAALAEAARISARVDRCDDLYGIAKGQPESVLDRLTQPVAEIPQDIAIELAKLDPGEVSTALTRSNGETLVFLMMCGRTAALSEDVTREQILQQLSNQRLASYAESYLAELRADAVIIRQ